MFNYFGSQYLITKFFSKSGLNKSKNNSQEQAEKQKPGDKQKKNTLLWLKFVLFLLLTLFVGLFWYYSYHIREEKHIIAQSDLEFDDFGSEISSTCGVDVHVFYDYSGLSIQSGHKAFYEKQWPYISKMDTIYNGKYANLVVNERCVVAQPGVVLVRTDTIHGKIKDLPKLSSWHANSMKRVFGDTMNINQDDLKNLNCYYRTIIDSPNFSSTLFLPYFLIKGKCSRRLSLDLDTLQHYKNVRWSVLKTDNCRDKSLRINYFEPTDTIFYYEEVFRLFENWGRLSFFSKCDLSRVSERIDFHAYSKIFDERYKGEEDGKLICFSMNNKLNSLHFYFGTNVKVEGGNVLPDSLEDGGFWIRNPKKLRQIEREGLTLHLLFPQMENMQNARLYLVTTLLTALATYTCTLLYRRLRQFSRKKRINSTITLIAVLLIVIVLTLFHFKI